MGELYTIRNENLRLAVGLMGIGAGVVGFIAFVLAIMAR